MADLDVLTAADIARLAGVTRATVSNWRRRHADFPEPVGGTASSPVYSRDAIEGWLASRGSLPELSQEERLWRRVRATAAKTGNLAGVVASAMDYLTGSDRGGTGAVTARLPDLADALAETVRAAGWQRTLDSLLDQLADAQGMRGIATPSPVADLMTAIADLREGDVVLDPAVGTGALLYSAQRRRPARLLGEDLDISVASVAARRFAGTDGAAIPVLAAGDSLRDDQFASVIADIVLCHPPFGIMDWGFDELADDPRWEYGTPARSEGELAWAQHALAHLRPGGRAVMLLPPAVASRPSGRRIRAELVRHGALRSVISLPAGVAEPRHVPLHIWAFERPTGEAKPDPKMLLIDASGLTGPWAEIADKVAETWATFRADDRAGLEEPGLWRVVPAIDLLDDDVDIAPARRVGMVSRPVDFSLTRTEMSGLHEKLRDMCAELGRDLASDDWDLRAELPRWRRVTVSELGRRESLAFHKASMAAPGDTDLLTGPDQARGRRVLLAEDVRSATPPSGTVPDGPLRSGWVVIRADDVILSAGAPGQAPSRVAGDEDENAILGRGLHLIRPDHERLDSWFLSGVLTNPENVQQAAAGSTSSRIDVRRLTVPVLPMADQLRIGAAFREIRELEARSREFARLTERYARLLAQNLAAGRLNLHTMISGEEQNSSRNTYVQGKER